MAHDCRSWPQGATGNFNSHRCELASNDDILIRHDHRSPEIPITPLVLVEVGNVSVRQKADKNVKKRKTILGCKYKSA